MLNPEDLPTDISFIAQDTIDALEIDQDTAASGGIILGQLDPTEIDHTTGRPRWTPSQQALIVKFRDKLSEWRDA